MSTIQTLLTDEVINETKINANFAALNSDKIETSVISTDNTMGGVTPSDSKLSTEKAIKEYVDVTASPTGKSWNEYAIANSGTDSYTITVPGVTALVAGQTFKFKADVANTGACTLNVNGLGAKAIKKNVSAPTVTGDILANQELVVIFDGTNMQLQTPVSKDFSPAVVKITTSQTYQIPAGVTRFLVELLGAGGSGGCYFSTNGNTQYAGGGGAGEYVSGMFFWPESKLEATTINRSFNITIGVGGNSVTASNFGLSGSSTSFDGFLVANGGGGGRIYSDSTPGASGTGGSVNQPFVKLEQTAGASGGSAGVYTSGGNGTNYGGGVTAGITSTVSGYVSGGGGTTGLLRGGYGCGGGGSCLVSGGGNPGLASGPGGHGLCIITLFYN